jgi:Tol biopolymer transport system component
VQDLERKIASFAYYPRWSPDGSQILFQTYFTGTTDRFYVVDLHGSVPQEVLSEFVAKHQFRAMSARWHPDGTRISVWVDDNAPAPTFWTVPVAGGEGVRSEIAPQIVIQIGEVSVGTERWGSAMDVDFSWAPSGKAIYFERTFRGAKNLWKMTVDPHTLRATSIERLTTGPGLDTQLAVSADGRKLAFTGETQHIRAWLFSFDANSGRISGKGEGVTSPGMDVWEHSLTRDGKKLAFTAVRAGKWELREKSLADGREAPIVPDDYIRGIAQWSPDGARLAYQRQKSSATEKQLMVWSGESHNEEPLTASSTAWRTVHDWSPDGKSLLISQSTNKTERFAIWLLPLAAAPHAEAAARKITSDPAYDLFQPHFSPNGRWIVFEAVRDSPNVESSLYVMPAGGGPWTPITDGKHWDDKPRWSPDGKTIYFVSGRGGFFNVRGIHFDPTNGSPVGEPFPVTAFENPSLRVPDRIAFVELSLNKDKLVLTMEERSGSIWVLDNVDQ